MPDGVSTCKERGESTWQPGSPFGGRCVACGDASDGVTTATVPVAFSITRKME